MSEILNQCYLAGMAIMNLVFNIFSTFLLFIMETTDSLLKKYKRHRIIKDRITNEAYLERYYLFLKDRQDFPFNIFLHKFLKSDPDDLHDHPWDYFTFILRGGYYEHTPKGKTWRRPFTFKCGKATDLHRIELDPDVPDCWTLFIPMKKKREWGFKKDGEWINNEEYQEIKKR